MSLRAQLLVFGLLTLGLPWAGLRFVQELESALRSGLEAALLASAGTVAAALSSQADSVSDSVWHGSAESGRTIYAHVLRAPPRIDGFRDDWVLERPEPIELDDASIWVGADERFVYFFVAVRDLDVVYEELPGRPPYGDRIVVLLGDPSGGRRALVLATAAPGTFRARDAEPDGFVPGAAYEGRVLAAWQETGSGFNVEGRIPIGLTRESLGLGIVDVDRAADAYSVEIVATWGAERAAPSALVYERARARALVEQFTQAGERFRVLDGNGWVIASSGSVGEPAAAGPGEPGLIDRLFRLVLSRDDPPYAMLENPPGRLDDPALRPALEGRRATAWYGRGPGSAAVVAAAVPIEASLAGAATRTVGAVLLEQTSDPILTLADRALMRLTGLTVTISVGAALALFGYATFLSFRVRRLARAAETALSPRGEINTALPGRAARDEIGALARSFGDLLRRLEEYTEYLRTLSGKLTHELRTPLAIVTTSLDNLRHEVREGSADVYLGRLREGAERLDSILAAMGAATKIEHAIAAAAVERYDLAGVLSSCAEAYADIYPQRTFSCMTPPARCAVLGSSELFAQLLDKLVENAVSFSRTGSAIALSLDATPSGYEVAVRNEGRPLPDAMRHQLFDSLVSMRADGDDRPHLGLGLHIVALIADFHGASATADNLPDGSGVIVRVLFPRA